jgi:hypothetical protein
MAAQAQPVPAAQTGRNSVARARESKFSFKEKTALRGQISACRHQHTTAREILRGKDDKQAPGIARRLLFWGLGRPHPAQAAPKGDFWLPCTGSRAARAASRAAGSVPRAPRITPGETGPVCGAPRAGSQVPRAAPGEAQPRCRGSPPPFRGSLRRLPGASGRISPGGATLPALAATLRRALSTLRQRAFWLAWPGRHL